MDDVIENCQTTFEEDGVNQQTLDDLRKVGPFFPIQLFVVDDPIAANYRHGRWCQLMHCFCVERPLIQDVRVHLKKKHQCRD